VNENVLSLFEIVSDTAAKVEIKSIDLRKFNLLFGRKKWPIIVTQIGIE
tara:strand:- start:659 stop:805 length:147 start_codon:yes stop_codon:yes gene_type:complete